MSIEETLPKALPDAKTKPAEKDPTRPVMWIIVCAVLFVLGTLVYQALSGREAYIAEYAAQSRAWEASHGDVIPALRDAR